MNVAVIPARGGSERIPRKNIRSFCGSPIIAHPIRTALDSGLFARVIVSTDDGEIAEVARSCGAKTPFMRPRELADSQTATLPVVAHAVDWMKAAGWGVESVCCIYPTAVFTSTSLLSASYERLTAEGWEFVFAACRLPVPVDRTFRILTGGGIAMDHPESYGRRSQDLQPHFYDAGQFYWGRAGAWLHQPRIFSERSSAMIVSRLDAVDIDTEEDWIEAEILYRRRGTETRDGADR